jgi:5-methylcytosine-specific restriction endonuclease McrA
MRNATGDDIKKIISRAKKEALSPQKVKSFKKLNPRFISQRIKIFVSRRDQGMCRWEENGVRCCSTKKLEFDHINPIALGGKSTEENVWLLCEKHNRKKGKKRLSPLDFKSL